jgi:hypothetical protein
MISREKLSPAAQREVVMTVIFSGGMEVATL